MNCMWYLYKSENWCKIITVFDGSRRLFRVFRKELLWDVMVEVLWQKPGNAFHFVFGWSSPSALSPYTLGDHFQYWMFWIRCVQSVVDEMETCQFSLNAFIYSIELSYCHSNVSGWISVWVLDVLWGTKTLHQARCLGYPITQWVIQTSVQCILAWRI